MFSIRGGNVIQTNHNVFYISNICESYLNCPPVSIKFRPGIYKIECWGAYSNCARGAYVSGKIKFSTEIELFGYIGIKTNYFNAVPKNTSNKSPGFPGGATDLRLVDGEYESFNSLKSRIIVAAGAGGCDWVGNAGGFGGSLTGGTGSTAKNPEGVALENPAYAHGGTQTSGGKWENYVLHSNKNHYGFEGHFGLAGYFETSSDMGGIGGGGYYGGASRNTMGTAGGGSSFVSGYEGCDAIFENSTEGKIIHSHQPIHYSGYHFNKIEMKGGNETSSLHYNSITNDGNGYIRITIYDHFHCTCKSNSSHSILNKLSLIILVSQ